MVVEDVRCIAFIRHGERAGERCKRNASENSRYCSQHHKLLKEDTNELLEFIKRNAKIILSFIAGGLGQAIVADAYMQFKNSKNIQQIWGSWGDASSSSDLEVSIDFETIYQFLKNYIDNSQDYSNEYRNTIVALESHRTNRHSHSMLTLLGAINPHMGHNEIISIFGTPDKLFREDPTPDARSYYLYFDRKGYESTSYPVSRSISLFIVFSPLSGRAKHVIVEGRLVTHHKTEDMDRLFARTIEDYRGRYGSSGTRIP